MAVTLKAKKPEPKFTTVEELRTYMFSISLHQYDKARLIDPNYYPCTQCGGKGKIRKMEDRCPVEGFKGAPWYACEFCGGAGKVHPSYYEPLVEQELHDHERATKHYEELLNKFNGILGKVEPEEVEFLLKNVEIVPDPK